ncbi:MAG: DHA2 family efflux MFS transporter permease subunit [Bacteroidetes bacterium]|nr:DHA2 family efflux MFS transporter permease subunit [Bacteroidota bacterium]
MASVDKIAKIIIAVTTISAAIMELIDTSIVNVALNQMAGNLGASIEDIAWVITSYAIANVIIIPMTGFLAAYFGRRRYYMASIAIFTIASIFCGMSTSLWQIVLWRFVQGLGGGGLLSTSQSILFETFPGKQRGLAAALFGMGVVLGPTLGPVVGGVIIDTYSWPLIFYINVPFGIIASLLTYRFIPDSLHDYGKPRIDWSGIFLLTIGIGALQYVLERGEAEDWFDSRLIIWLTVVAVVGLATFIWWELQQKEPVVNLRILKDWNLTVTTMLTFIVGFILFTSVFVFPLMLQRVLGYTAYETGLTLLPASILSLIFMPFIGKRLQAGTPPKFFVTIGFITLMGFGILMSRADLNVTSSFFALPLMIRGAGLACLFVPLNAMAVAGLQPKDIPQGVALNNMMRQLGGSFGIAIINNYIAHRVAVHRTDLISNIYSGGQMFTERYNQVYQGLQSKLPVAANLQQQTYQVIELTIMKQTYMLSYLDAFLYATLFILAAFPLIFFTRNKRISAEQVEMAEEAH